MLHYAILGTNWLSQRYKRAMGAVGSQLTAVCSRSLERAREFGGEAVLAYDNLDRLLENPEIDAVYLCLPNCLHAETAIRCLRAGKHVLCEKPATASTAELEAVLQAAEESGRVFAEAVMNFYSPVMDWLRGELAGNPVASVRLDYSQRSSKLDDIRAGGMASSFDRSLYGGVLSDLGVYPLHFAVNLFGAPNSITTAAQFIGAVDGTDVLTLRYDGFDVVITVSKCCHSMLGSEILCDRATYTLKNVSVVLGVEKHTMEETEPVDCGIEVSRWPVSNPAMLDGVQERVLRTFARWAQGEDLARCKLLQQESLTVQRLMEEAHRQMGY